MQDERVRVNRDPLFCRARRAAIAQRERAQVGDRLKQIVELLRLLGVVLGSVGQVKKAILEPRVSQAGVRAAPGALGEARYDALPAAGRLRLHGAVADALERQPNADVADLARHWCAAAPLGQPERAVRYARLAAERARSSVALVEAIRHYESALQAESLLADPIPALRCDLLTGYGEALHRIGDPRHREILMKAAALAEDLDVERLAAAWSSPSTSTAGRLGSGRLTSR